VDEEEHRETIKMLKNRESKIGSLQDEVDNENPEEYSIAD
jgi:hypothetical protein